MSEDDAMHQEGGGPMVDHQTKRRALALARGTGIVLLLVAVAALVGYALYQQRATRAQSRRLRVLEQRVATLSTDQRLLAAMVEVDSTSSTSTPSTQETATQAAASPGEPGTRRLFGAVTGVTKASYGWELRVDPAEYVTGTPAFSLASSMGKLTNSDGSFVLDTSDRTTRLKLLKDAKVTVVAWPDTPADAAPSISALELAEVLPGGKSTNPQWAKSWFWLDVRDGYVLQVTQQRVK